MLCYRFVSVGLPTAPLCSLFLLPPSYQPVPLTKAGESERERPESHDLAGAFCFSFSSRSTLKNWNGAGAGVGAGIINAAPGPAIFKNFVKNDEFRYFLAGLKANFFDFAVIEILFLYTKIND